RGGPDDHAVGAVAGLRGDRPDAIGAGDLGAGGQFQCHQLPHVHCPFSRTGSPLGTGIMVAKNSLLSDVGSCNCRDFLATITSSHDPRKSLKPASPAICGCRSRRLNSPSSMRRCSWTAKTRPDGLAASCSPRRESASEKIKQTAVIGSRRLARTPTTTTSASE